MTSLYQCVVVANGLFPTTQLALDNIKNVKYIIACDGAIRHLHNLEIKADAIVGDLDSIPNELKSFYKDRIHWVENQDINDLTKAVFFAEEQGFTELLILGATGLREDHALGNISLLIDYASLFEHIEMMSDYGIFTPILKEENILHSFPGQQVSIISMTPQGEISSEGLKWELSSRRFTSWWQGTLNEAIGDSFKIKLSPQSAAIIYRAF